MKNKSKKTLKRICSRLKHVRNKKKKNKHGQIKCDYDMTKESRVIRDRKAYLPFPPQNSKEKSPVKQVQSNMFRGTGDADPHDVSQFLLTSGADEG